ncbi:hypothetical protein N656DRAFT_690724, partial [Canariomyces notabilis]
TNLFTITAAPGTDIWRKPPTTDVFNAPAVRPPGVAPSAGPLLSFLSARVSLRFNWRDQYDQGGLLLSFIRREFTTIPTSSSPPPQKWIKTGIEFYNGSPRLSTVACDAWADWSVAELQAPTSSADATTTTTDRWTTVEIAREEDQHGTSLWVYQVLDSGEKVPLREICWVFGDRPEEWEVEVKAMAARPGKGVPEGEGLVVEFGGMEVKWS